MPRSRNFAAELRDECLNGEIFYSLKEAIVVLEQWRNQYNTIRPHSSLVERFFAWIQWQRRILVRWEFYPKNFLGFVQLACLIILFKRF